MKRIGIVTDPLDNSRHKITVTLNVRCENKPVASPLNISNYSIEEWNTEKKDEMQNRSNCAGQLKLIRFTSTKL